MSDLGQDVFGTLGEIMVGAQYIGMFLIAGLVLLISAVLPFPWLRRTRMVLGIICLVMAAAIYVWLSMDIGG